MNELEATAQAYQNGYDKGYAEGLEAGRKEASGWISVKDRLPETFARVIVCREEGKVEQGRWIVINDCDGHRYYSTAITVTPENYDIVRDEYPGYSEPMCSECHGKALLNGAEEYVLSAFCPNCGAKMDGERTGGKVLGVEANIYDREE